MDYGKTFKKSRKNKNKLRTAYPKKECITIAKKNNNEREKQTMSNHKNDIFKKQQTHNASQNVYLILIGTGDLTISA